MVSAIDEAAQNWGVKVLRYEIKDITSPQSVMDAMEKQMRAEREKRAAIATSEGDRQARINRAAEKYIAEFGKLAKANNTMIIPANLGDISSMVATVMSVLEHAKQKQTNQPQAS